MRKVKWVIPLLLLCVLTLGSCATLRSMIGATPVDNTLNSWATMSPEQKSTVMGQQYLSFSASTRALSMRTDLTAGQKKLLHIEKNIVVRLQKAVIAYDDAFVKGDPMAMVTYEMEVLQLFNEWLTAQLMGGK
jgi:hypothetical protein